MVELLNPFEYLLGLFLHVRRVVKSDFHFCFSLKSGFRPEVLYRFSPLTKAPRSQHCAAQ
jgi:hypothetical protein